MAVAVFLAATALMAQETGKNQTPAQDPEEITRLKLETIQKEISVLRQEAARLNEQETPCSRKYLNMKFNSRSNRMRSFCLKLKRTKREGIFKLWKMNIRL